MAAARLAGITHAMTEITSKSSEWKRNADVDNRAARVAAIAGRSKVDLGNWC